MKRVYMLMGMLMLAGMVCLKSSVGFAKYEAAPLPIASDTTPNPKEQSAFKTRNLAIVL